MKVIIRTDASVDIGSGHVMRCLTIAHKLRKLGCNVLFWMEQLEGNLIDYVINEGFSIIHDAKQADLYIIDHYQLGIDWERSIRSYTKKIFIIDDLARMHDCDILLDQNIIPNYLTRYDGKVPTSCEKLLGPKYLIMRDEFVQARQFVTQRNGQIKRLFVFMGGTDPTNETMKIMEALRSFSFEHVDVVVGAGNLQKALIQQICHERGYSYHCQINYIAKLMAQADFAIGAGGSTMWERCFLGLPSSATIVAENQRETTNYAEQLGVVVNLGWHDDISSETYKSMLEKQIRLESLSEKASKLIQQDQPNSWVYPLLHMMNNTK